MKKKYYLIFTILIFSLFMNNVLAVKTGFVNCNATGNSSDKNPARLDIEFNIKNFFFSLLRIPVIKNIPLIMDIIWAMIKFVIFPLDEIII